MKKLLFIFLILAASLTHAANSLSDILAATLTSLSHIKKAALLSASHPYILASLAAAACAGIYARQRYNKIQHTYSDHQNGYCDLCKQKNDLCQYCRGCDKEKSFLYFFTYSHPRAYCYDCLKNGALHSSQFNCIFCNRFNQEALLLSPKNDKLL